jgi:hypothetical protein
MIEEMASIEHNQTWSLVDWPVGQHAIGLKWVFKIKKGEHENITKHKARLVAKGYVHQEGIDYEEVFAQVTRIESMRVFLAVAVHRSWSVHHSEIGVSQRRAGRGSLCANVPALAGAEALTRVEEDNTAS